ncbi:MAG: serine protease [Saprospiraceae bacterium]|jgi:subtilisin family serine protease
MKKYNSYLIIIFALLIVNKTTAQKLNHVLGEVIVEVKSDIGAKSLVTDINAISKYRSNIQATKLMAEPMNLWILKVDPNLDNEIEFLETVKMNRHTLLAQKNHLSQLRETIPNDPLFDSQWQYINLGSNGGQIGADIDMELAWDHTTGGKTIDGDDIVVCVIDDGIITSSPDLEDNLWVNTAEIADNGIDDDENGYVDDVRGWNAGDDNDNVYQGGGHGTSVAGIIGAKGNNEVGVAGVNWDVKLMIIIGGSPEALALASYAYPYQMRKLYNETNGEKGAFVVCTNASWGVDMGDPNDAPIWCDFYNVLGEVGILNFGATINGNTNVDVQGDLPTGCSSDFLVSVTNMNRQDEKVTGAGYGTRSIDLGAFGAQTYTLSGSNYGSFGGTSGATPHCAGTAALLYAADCSEFMSVVKNDPAQAALAVKDYILHGVDPNQSLQGITTTGGRLNANNAMLNLLSTCGDCTDAYGARFSEIQVENAKLVWLDNGKIGTVSVRYKVLDAADWIEINDISSGYQFTNLSACTAYEYQIKTTCNGQTDSEYTYPRLFETDGCCVAPEGVSAVIEGDNIVIDWGSVTAATNFIVEYRNIEDPNWTIANLGTDNSFSFSGIEDCQYYEIRIKSECAANSNESEFTEVIGLSTECGNCTREYCAFGVKNIDDEWIESVVIDGVFENFSGVNNSGYGNFVGQFDINLDQGKEYEIVLSPGHTSTPYDEFFSTYIDYNQDGEFSDEEAIYTSESGTQIAVSGLFSIPIESTLGITRMRVIMRYDEINPSGCDNGSFVYGEIEDYCVNIMPKVNTIDINDTQYTVYPTLTSDLLTIDLGNEITNDGSIDIVSIQNGQTVKRKNITSSQSIYTVDMSEYTSGVYMVVINVKGDRIVQKVVKF